MDEQPDEKRMKLRYPGACRVCHVEIPARTDAIYERTTKTVRCLEHERNPTANPLLPEDQPASGDIPSVDVGVAGASARREFDRRRQAREARVRTKHPKLGGLLLALSEDPQSTTAWSTGALGEERLGARLNELSTDSLLVLHDRRIPRTRANIDHIAVTPTGIWVIDAKKYRGRPALKVEGGLLRQRTEKVLVGTRDCSQLVDGMLKQVSVVEDVLLPGGRPEGSGRPFGRVPVHGVLCFVESGLAAHRRSILHPERRHPVAQEVVPASPGSRPTDVDLDCRDPPPPRRSPPTRLTPVLPESSNSRE